MDFSSFSPGAIVAVVVSLALAPFVAVMVTSYTKIVVVLSLLRNALGLQQVPPNVVLNGLAIILSVYVMYPVFNEAYDGIEKQVAQFTEEQSDTSRLFAIAEQGKKPLQQFLFRHSEQSERQFFLKSIEKLMGDKGENSFSEKDFVVVVPAFVVSELTDAFQIGFVIFLPFLVIDLIVSNILLALGMMMLAPTTVSLPFKLLLFVFISGWTHLVQGLVMTYL
ncbi:MAG: EscR/YscR/HrcR family type III secretion system export apparatus protein [Gammaproteobacteria bacterium]|nr:MAG: EscR/YscR/HrcR family type III secretion system export apparatus protein [Pseudomonadota bacterium]PIE38875.1 MAG: EscR/YscR/HrcR family type III secretion system export apparatus protein [Gammaproteobacteria bacterium]